MTAPANDTVPKGLARGGPRCPACGENTGRVVGADILECVRLVATHFTIGGSSGRPTETRIGACGHRWRPVDVDTGELGRGTEGHGGRSDDYAAALAAERAERRRSGRRLPHELPTRRRRPRNRPATRAEIREAHEARRPTPDARGAA